MDIMPDAPKDQVISNIIGASAAPRAAHMAISVAVFVGEASEWILRCGRHGGPQAGAWDDPEAAYGPVITPQAGIAFVIRAATQAQRFCSMAPTAPCGVCCGWIGPTLFSDVTPEMDIYREVVPCCAMTVDTLDDAILD